MEGWIVCNSNMTLFFPNAENEVEIPNNLTSSCLMALVAASQKTGVVILEGKDKCSTSSYKVYIYSFVFFWYGQNQWINLRIVIRLCLGGCGQINSSLQPHTLPNWSQKSSGVIFAMIAPEFMRALSSQQPRFLNNLCAFVCLFVCLMCMPEKSSNPREQ